MYKFNDANNLELFDGENKDLYFNKYSPYLNIYAGIQWVNQRLQNLNNEKYPIIQTISRSLRNYNSKNLSKILVVKMLHSEILPKLFFAYALGEIIEDKNKKSGLFRPAYDDILKNTNDKHYLSKEGRLLFYKNILSLKNISSTIKNMLNAYVEYEEDKLKYKIEKSMLTLKEILNKYYEIKCNKNTEFLPILQLKEKYMANFTTQKRTSTYIVQIERLKGISKNLYKKSGLGDLYDFMSLSTGEQRILRFMADVCLIANGKTSKISKNDIFIFDEMDLSWHPEWQRKMIYYIVDLFTKISQMDKTCNRKFNLIFTTHSPFILSDMPKDSVTILKNNSGNITVEHPNINTFATNIHELFKEGLFIKSTIGEFAQVKIKDILSAFDEISSINRFEEIEQKINIIGEPIIKKQLLKLLYENKYCECYDKNNDKIFFEQLFKNKQKIQCLENQINILKQKLKEKEVSNEKNQ